jgi:3-hydroxyisobutyrate dehydrogenase
MPDILYEPQIALLGTGHIGGAMGRHILQAGYTLVAWDRSHKAATNLAGLGAQIATSPVQAVTGADIIISILRHDSISREVWLGHHDALAHVKPRAVAVECSTLPFAFVHELAAAADARNVRLLDAPVIGDVIAAQNAALHFLVGGREDTLISAQEVLNQLGTVTYVGASGSGAVLKLVYSLLAGTQTLALAEGVALARRAGLAGQQVLDMLNATTLNNTHAHTIGQRILNADFETERGDVRRITRDLGYVLQLAAKHGLDVSTAQTSHERFAAAEADGLGEHDAAVIFRRLFGE